MTLRAQYGPNIFNFSFEIVVTTQFNGRWPSTDTWPSPIVSASPPNIVVVSNANFYNFLDRHLYLVSNVFHSLSYVHSKFIVADS